MGKPSTPKAPDAPKTRQASATEEKTTAEQISSLQSVIEKLVSDNKNLTTKVEESIKSTEFISNKYDDNENNIKEILEKLKELTEQNNNLLEKNLKLEKELENERTERKIMEERFLKIINPLEIQQRENNLELHGLVEKDNEDTKKEVQRVMSLVTPEPVVIINSYRFGAKIGYDGKKRNRPIIIKFSNKDHRDKVYGNRTNLKKQEEERLYLNENLPPSLNILKGKANTIRKEKKYKFLWTSNGNILIRKNEQSDVINIKVPSDLEKIV